VISIEIDFASLEPEPTWVLDLFDGERWALTPPPDLTVSQWADERRILQPGTSRQAGPWRTATTPYLREPMDAYNDPQIRHLVLCFGTQLGKTETLYNVLGYIIDHEPYSTLLVYPREEDGKTISRARVQPMVEECPTLAAKIPERQELYQLCEQYYPGMVLYIVGANSAAALSQKSCRNILRDEVDKFPEKVGKDADPFSLSEERAKAFWDIRKVVDVSSPILEARGSWALMQRCEQVKKFMVPCPFCGAGQELVHERIQWDSEEGAEWDRKILIAKHTARYECEKCGRPIVDDHKQSMLTAGKWVDTKTIERGLRPESVGFHLSSFYSPWLTWGDCAEEYLKAKREQAETGSKKRLQNYKNGWRALPWIDAAAERQETAILALRDGYPRGYVPTGVLGLVAGVDTQDNGFFYKILGVGAGFECWVVREGFIDSFEALDRLLEGRYQGDQGAEWVVSLTLIDAMGHRTSEVYEFCRGRVAVKPAQGTVRMGAPWNTTRIDFFPDSKRPIPGGVILYRINAQYYKDLLHNKLAIAPGDPGGYHLHSDATEDYARQMVAEFRNDKGEWENRAGRANHYWDCGYLSLAAADILGVQHWGGAPQVAGGGPSGGARRENTGKRRASRW